MFHEVFRQRCAAGFFGHQHEVDIGEAHTARGFRRQHARQAQFHQPLPTRGVIATSRGAFRQFRRTSSSTQHGGRGHVVQQLAHGGGHHPLLFGEGEIHGPYLGMPSTRSAMMLR